MWYVAFLVIVFRLPFCKTILVKLILRWTLAMTPLTTMQMTSPTNANSAVKKANW